MTDEPAAGKWARATSRTTVHPGSVPGPLRDYLHRLDDAARLLPVADRQDLRAHVWSRVASAAGPVPTESLLVEVLADLGRPEDLVPRPVTDGVAPAPAAAPVHLLGFSLLTVGVTGVLGLIRLWRSPSWPTRYALCATALVLTGGFLLPLLTAVHPVIGILLGGLGVGAPMAGLLLGAVLLHRRRRYHKCVRPHGGRSPGQPLRTPRGGGRSAPHGRCDPRRRTEDSR